MSKENAIIKRGKAFFNIVGKAKIGEYTYKIDEVAKSGWQYNVLNLGIDCGEGNVVYTDMMGGFSTVRDNVLYVNSKEDFMNRYTIDWEDRFLDPILEGINGMNFIKVGLEKDTSGKTFTKQFLSEYDAINYIKEHLENDMVINVRGDLKYSIYNDTVQIRKEVTSIFLSRAEPEDYRATFVQSLLLNEDSIGKLDKDTATYPISAYAPDYTKMYGDKEVKTTIPFPVALELEVNKENPKATKALIDKVFTVEKDTISEVAVEGKIIEGQQTKELTEDDIPEDMLELIELGILDKEDVLNKMVVSGDRVRRYVITKPYVQMKGEDEDRKPVLFIEHNKYKAEDMIFDFMYDDSDDEDIEDEEEIVEDDSSEDTGTDDDWLNALG